MYSQMRRLVTCFFLVYPMFGHADTAAYETCVAAISAASQACTVASQLPAGSAAAFQSGQNAICDLNYHVLENVNHMFCFLKNEIAFDGSATGSTTVSGSAYTWTYETTGLEAFATTQGYSKKLQVSKGGILQMSLWWDGTDTSTKGYMISNKLGITLSNELAIYVQWDKTATAQWVRYMRGTWSSSNTGGPLDSVGGELSRVKYGYMGFDSSTDAVSGLEIVDVKGNAANATTDCDKYRIWGKTSGTLAIWNASIVSKTSTTVDTTGGTGATYPVSSGTSSGSVSSFSTTADSVTGPGSFSKSCNNIYETRDGGTSNFFDANADSVRLTFTQTPVLIFGTAIP